MMATRLEKIARLMVNGWTLEHHIYTDSVSKAQREVLISAFATTLQAVQDEERKGFRQMIEGAIETCKQHNMAQGAQVLQIILESEPENGATDGK
jgi:hypothetical protein